MLHYLNLPISIYFDTDTYIAECSSIQGAYAEGETPEEAKINLIEVVKMIQEYDIANKKEYIRTSFQMQSDRIFTTLPILQPQYA